MNDTEASVIDLNDKVTHVITQLREVEVEFAELKARNDNMELHNQAVGYENDIIKISQFEQRKMQLQ